MFCCLPYASGSQTVFTKVEGLPTNEIFDLLVDKKGYVWVGHDMGISRFDGVSFTPFSHPERSSLSITDIIEDNQGKIWFHNFTGQIFYIENERVHLLKAYRNEAEDVFPRMVLLGDELVVTSNKGLFVCNTRTLESRYEVVKGPKYGGTRSLARVGNQVMAIHINRFYLYDKKNGFRAVKLPQPHIYVQNRNMVLQTEGLGDTALMIANPSGTMYQLKVQHNEIKMVGTRQLPDFINSISLLKGRPWIHAKHASLKPSATGIEDSIEGLNISDMAVDLQGRLWVSSLTKGLMAAQTGGFNQAFQPSFLEASDLISAGTAFNDTLLLGSRNGWLFLVAGKQKNLIWKHKLPADVGGVNLISRQVGGRFIISTSLGTFQFYYPSKTIFKFFSFITKDVEFYRGRILVASAVGLISFPLHVSPDTFILRNIIGHYNWNNWWQRYRETVVVEEDQRYFWYLPRCRSIALTEDRNLYASFMNGVHYFDKRGILPLLHMGKRVYSNSLVAIGKKVYIGTLNKGLMVMEGGKLKMVGTPEGLFSESIIRLKHTGPYLWLLLDRGIQLLNLQTDRIISNIELPEESGSNVQDIILDGDTALIATNSGLLKVAMKPSGNYNKLHSELKLVVVNGLDTLRQQSGKLSHQQNTIQFHLSVPWYSPGRGLYFKYRLLGGTNTQWYYSLPGERIIRFASLMPGDYTFESYAVVSGFQEPRPVRYQFSIQKPWWRSWTFNITLLVLAALIFYGLYRMRVRQVLHLAQVRQAISSDLHDEIGSTISSINIYSELAKSETNNEPYLQLIQENTREVISKLDDLVWSINPRNDCLSQLVARMRSVAEPVLLGAGIQPRFFIAEGIDELELSLHAKRNFYLIYKELVNNVVKHSKATHCQIRLQLLPGWLELSISDDGIGFPENVSQKGRSGMYNMQERAQQVKARFFISSQEGQGTYATVQLPLK
ncbi:hypothetical protein BUE76_12780 [Cnuella takakiae]|nr:hypothetical protein BUE76_12780 [Cnuella takakiae]